MCRTLLLGLGILLTACDGPPTSVVSSHVDDSRVPDSLRAAYADDAALLALRHVTGTNDPAFFQVPLPDDLVQSLYDALILVHNAVALAARDSVVELYRIHTRGPWSVREILVGVDPAAEWLGPWRRGERLTRNAAVDTLMEKYGLDLRRFYDFVFDWDMAVLRAREALNTIALGALFEPIDGVVFAEPNGIVGDGNDIHATRLADGWRLDYSVGFGDCPSGCISRHHWLFGVFADGEVLFEGSSGPAPPPPGGPWPLLLDR